MQKRAVRSVILATALVALAACAPSFRDNSQPIAAQADVDPERFLGLWYEIARYPASFQEGCTATTAEYGRLDSETLSVVNTCRQGTPEGPVDRIEGSAEIVGPGQLKVKLNGVPFVRGDYWILWVDESYDTAVVGVPSGRAGWILARTTSIPAEKRAMAESVLRSNGYDTSSLIDVPHASN